MTIPPSDDPAVVGEWMARERKKRGWSTTDLANYARQVARREGSSMALTQQSVSGLEQPGKTKRIPDWVRYVQMVFEEGAPPQHQDQAPRDELAYIRKVDVRYAMGDGSAIEDYPETSLIPFNLGFLHSVTRAPLERLMLVSGHGDSMEPTLLRSDEILIDTTDKSLGLGDLIWALEYAGSGYIKKLRRVKRNGRVKVLIISDNPTYPIEEADPDDVRIIGKCVWVGRRLV